QRRRVSDRKSPRCALCITGAPAWTLCPRISGARGTWHGRDAAPAQPGREKLDPPQLDRPPAGAARRLALDEDDCALLECLLRLPPSTRRAGPGAVVVAGGDGAGRVFAELPRGGDRDSYHPGDAADRGAAHAGAASPPDHLLGHRRRGRRICVSAEGAL